MQDIARLIDHTLLKPDATSEAIVRLCAEAREHRFAAVCVNPYRVAEVAEALRGSDVAVCSVAGFPLGANTGVIKGRESAQALADGACEIDMVMNVGAIKQGNHAVVLEDIRAVVGACADAGAICKVILECCLLTDDEKRRAAEIAVSGGAAFVKTSTGFSTGGATVEDVRLLSECVKSAGVAVKASGGIRTYEHLRNMVEAGASRIGASAGVQILREGRAANEGA